MVSTQYFLRWRYQDIKNYFLIAIKKRLLYIFYNIQVINTTIIDFAISDKREIRREVVAGVVCLAAFSLATPNMFQGGIYLYKLLDWYTAVQSLAILAAFEICVICWIYGPEKIKLVPRRGFYPLYMGVDTLEFIIMEFSKSCFLIFPHFHRI